MSIKQISLFIVQLKIVYLWFYKKAGDKNYPLSETNTTSNKP